MYSEIVPFNTPVGRDRGAHAGRDHAVGRSPQRVRGGAPRAATPRSTTAGVPVLGICYGMQLMTDMLGGEVAPAPHREFGHAVIQHRPRDAPLLARSVRSCACGPATAISSSARPPDSPSRRPARTRRSPRWPTASRDLYALLFHPGSRAYRSRHRDSAQLRVRRLRLHRRLDDGVVRRGDGGGDPAPGRRRPGRLRAERRRRFDGRGAVDSQGDRRSADLHLRRQRGDAARRGGADPARASSGCKLPLVVADASRLFLDRLAGVTDPEKKRKIIGGGVHRRVRGRGEALAEDWAPSTSWRRARSIRT